MTQIVVGPGYTLIAVKSLTTSRELQTVISNLEEGAVIFEIREFCSTLKNCQVDYDDNTSTLHITTSNEVQLFDVVDQVVKYADQYA
jgi:hypothetical protein